jgi:hypothetical protein
LQHSIEALKLEEYSETLKNINTFDMKSIRYFNAISALELSLSAIMATAGVAASIPVTEIEVFLNDYGLMSGQIAAGLNGFNDFNAIYDSTVGLLQVAGADFDAIVASQRVTLTATEVSLTDFYTKKRQRLVWTALYCRALRLFFEETALLGVHTKYIPYYNTVGIAHVPGIHLELDLLEQMRTEGRIIGWMRNSPIPVIRLEETFALLMTAVRTAFPGAVILSNIVLLQHSVDAVDLMQDSVNVAPGTVRIDALEQFERGKNTRFFLNAALDSFASAAEPPARAIGDGQGDGGTAGPKVGAAVKAGAKRAKKIRFELDDAQFPTISEDAV